MEPVERDEQAVDVQPGDVAPESPAASDPAAVPDDDLADVAGGAFPTHVNPQIT